MTVATSNGLAALSLLTNTNGFALYPSTVATESRAVRLAKAAFTAKPSATPPWKQPAVTTPLSSQLTAIRAMKTIIDPPIASFDPAGADVQTSFVTYKALDRLHLLATAAAKTTTSVADRAGLQTAFAKGLADLHAFLATAATDSVELSFGLPTHRAESVPIAPATATKVQGGGVNAVRDAPIAGLTGSEQFRITLAKPGGSDSLAIDLSQGPQPPTLDSIAGAINTAIAAIPARNADGTLLLDALGATIPKWSATIGVDNSSGKWGLSINAPGGIEQVAIDQVGAPDALVVAGGQTATGAPAETRLWRMNDAAGAMTRITLGDLAAVDRNATAAATLTATADAAAIAVARKKATATATPAAAATPAAPTVFAPTTTAAIVTDATGASYSVGTTSGDIGSNRSTGTPDLFVTKRDSEGAVVWQRSLGATGGAQGAAITLTAAGDIVVAGTVTGAFDGATTDGDMIVAEFSANGDERFTTTVRAGGSDTATAVAVGTDGSIYLGGRAASGVGDAFVARLSATGTLAERRSIDSGGSDSVKALAIGADGNPLALISSNGTASLRSFAAGSLATDIASVALGQADARAIAVAADGSIAIGGSTSAALAGGQINAIAGGRNGFVTTLDAGLGSARTVYIGSGSDDQVDSIAFMNGSIYAGGRTTGALDGTALRGSVDGFVSRIDGATGSIATTSQFGMTARRTEPVLVAAAPGGSTALAALGLHRGALNPPASVKLVAQTSLRAGDEFSIRMEGGTTHKITIAADDTLASLAARIRSATGSKATITVAATRTVSTAASGAPGSTATTTAAVGSPSVLRIDAQAGHSIEIVAGAAGKDALAKLGIAPARLSVPTVAAHNAPRVRPGGNFGLALTDALTIGTVKDAAVTLASLKSATSMTQTAYRSLYWDAGKAKVADGASGAGTLSTYQKAQLAGYQAALARLTPVADTTTSTSYTGF